MAVDVSRIEIDRIDNLIRNFGWIISKQEILEGEITLIIKKTIPAISPIGAPGAD